MVVKFVDRSFNRFGAISI